MKGFCQAKETEPKRSGVLAGLVTTGGVCCVCRQVTTSVKLKKNMLESVFGLPQAVELVPEIVVFCLNGTRPKTRQKRSATPPTKTA